MIIFDQSIVYKCDTLFLVIVRVSIDIGLVSMGRPPCMAQADVMLVLCSAFKLHPFDAIAAKPITGGKLCANKFSALRVYSDDAT